MYPGEFLHRPGGVGRRGSSTRPLLLLRPKDGTGTRRGTRNTRGVSGRFWSESEEGMDTDDLPLLPQVRGAEGPSSSPTLGRLQPSGSRRRLGRSPHVPGGLNGPGGVSHRHRGVTRTSEDFCVCTSGSQSSWGSSGRRRLQLSVTSGPQVTGGGSVGVPLSLVTEWG